MPNLTEAYKPNMAAFAVADAMMNTQAYHLSHYWEKSRWIKNPPSLEYLEDCIASELIGGCFEESTRIIEYLAQKHRYLFDLMVVVSARKDQQPLFKGPYDYHAYFLVRSKEGIYFAASPANTDFDPDNLTRLFVSPNLKKVMRSIEKREGERWPNPDFITVNTKRPEILPQIVINPEGIPLVTILEITRQGKEHSLLANSSSPDQKITASSYF